MSMINTGDILETIEMFTQDNLDVRTVTMGISLLDCIDPDPKKACEKVYNKITTKAANLVPAVEHISAEYGIPIINKRISVTQRLFGGRQTPDRVHPPRFGRDGHRLQLGQHRCHQGRPEHGRHQADGRGRQESL